MEPQSFRHNEGTEINNTTGGEGTADGRNSAARRGELYDELERIWEETVVVPGCVVVTFSLRK